MKKARVVKVTARNGLGPDAALQEKKLQRMFQLGISQVLPSGSSRDNVHHLFREQDRIGIKINTIGGRKLSTRPEVTQALCHVLTQAGRQELIVWDRTNRELKEAGYRLNLSRDGLQVFGTDSRGIGYDSYLVSHKNIGSLFSAIQSRRISASLSLAMLKDHGLAGITAGMKNYFGAIHNPNKYHDFNCDPFVAELFETAPIQQKHRLTIVDALLVQYHRGPAFHGRWARHCGTLIFSDDPVAADYVGWQMIEKLRAEHGLPSLAEEKREPKYILTAGKLGLGQSDPKFIEVIENETT
jgi:uncharacterized protein (DUF362 family)